MVIINQHVHDQLQRGLARDFLQALMNAAGIALD